MDRAHINVYVHITLFIHIHVYHISLYMFYTICRFCRNPHTLNIHIYKYSYICIYMCVLFVVVRPAIAHGICGVTVASRPAGFASCLCACYRQP